MANPIVSLFCSIWTCVRGSLRIILFVSCLLFVMIQLGMVFSQLSTEGISEVLRKDLLDQPTSLASHLIAFSLLFIASLGTYGAFYNHQRSLKTFAILVALSSIIFTFSLAYSAGEGEMSKLHKQIVDRLSNYSKVYDWSGRKYDEDRATVVWDLLQEFKCCGLNGPKDWDKLRPSGISKDLYPSSCCKHSDQFNQLCPEDRIYDSHCLYYVETMESLTIMMTVCYMAFQFLLSIIAYILLIPGHSSDSRSTSSNRMVLPQEYQRYEGSVYVRQPAFVPHYQQQESMVKSSTPPMYPNTLDAEKKSASSPPPNYY